MTVSEPSILAPWKARLAAYIGGYGFDGFVPDVFVEAGTQFDPATSRWLL